MTPDFSNIVPSMATVCFLSPLLKANLLASSIVSQTTALPHVNNNAFWKYQKGHIHQEQKEPLKNLKELKPFSNFLMFSLLISNYVTVC